MRRMKDGFTLIEVMLFLVLSSALFVAVAVGTHNSIFQQRYNDSVQNFVEFLRGIYSQVSNVENYGQGRSDLAIYGKLITFGEGYDLSGEQTLGKNTVFIYDVIGKIGDIGTGTALKTLSDLSANVITYDEVKGEYRPSGVAASYTPKWAAAIEGTSGYSNFTGSILIVRHPRSGTIFTYYSENTVQVNDIIRTAIDGIVEGVEAREVNPLLDVQGGKRLIDSFTIGDVDFCVNPTPGEANKTRRNVRLVGGARNASGIILPAADGEDNKCSE